jgi:protein-disulfide isomerase
MKPRIWISAIAACAFLAGSVATGLAAGTMTKEQRQEFEQVIKDYLLANPQAVLDALTNAQQWQETRKMSDNAERLFRSPNAFVAGNPDGDISLVEFFDYNCGYCKRAMDDVLAYIEEDPNVRVIMREFPILGRGSVIASQAALASRKQNKYWEFHLALMGTKGIQNEAQVMEVAKSVGLDTTRLKQDMQDPAIMAAIGEGHELATALGINGTPTFVLDDQLLPNVENLKEALASATAEIRANGGCKVC